MRDIVLVNNLLTGCMGERVLWDFLLEGIPNIQGMDLRSHQSFTDITSHIETQCSPDVVVIQNASFLPKIANRRTIAFLQDNLRGMGRTNAQQEHVLRTSDYVVFNSIETSKSYSDYEGSIIPIGIDSNLFAPQQNRQKLKNKYNLKEGSPVGIFVGDFTDVKGWKDVLHVIRYYPHIQFILVTKGTVIPVPSNAQVFQRIDQQQLCELINCSDFFILGSPIETQCLAALEAALCDVPILMRPTGIFMDWSKEDRARIGVFTNNLINGVEKILSSQYLTPRQTVQSKNLDITTTIEKWKTLLDNI